MRAPAAAILIGWLSSACAIGMTTDRFKPAGAPQGIQARVVTSRGELTGELIEVRDTAVVLLSNEGTPAPGIRKTQRLRLIPFASITRADFEQMGPDVRLRNGRQPSERARERLRLLSRFPYGMSPAVENALLKAHGQDAFAGAER